MIIRSDKLQVKVTTPEQEAALSDTLRLYRTLVRDLMTLAYTHWPELGRLTGTEVIAKVEGLIHRTNARPSVRYAYFGKRYYKFPSYLRRSAIMDAVGQVRSFVTRYNQWAGGIRKSRTSRPPCLTTSTNTFPSLYWNQCIKFNESMDQAFIKVWFNGDWIWMTFSCSGQMRYQGKGEALSPLLSLKNKKWSLSLPQEFKTPKQKPNPSRMLSFDVGINTCVTWAVVDQTGTVHARGFIKRSDKDQEQRLMQRIRLKARKQTRHASLLPLGFCARSHQKLTNLADNESHQISRRVLNLAIAHNCQGIVAENLKGFRPKAGKKRSPMKARFHRWFHRMLVKRLKDKAKEIGMKTILVYPRGTSSEAFDGSGQVKRDKNNYSLCTFANGKRYHADLNAAYNIAARGFITLQGKKREPKARAVQQKSDRTPRTSVTLSTLWDIPKAA